MREAQRLITPIPTWPRLRYRRPGLKTLSEHPSRDYRKDTGEGESHVSHRDFAQARKVATLEHGMKR